MEQDHLGPYPCALTHCCRLVTQSCPTPWDPMDRSPPGSSVHGIARQESWSGLPLPSPRDLPDPGIKPTFPALASRFLTAEPPRKPSLIY